MSFHEAVPNSSDTASSDTTVEHKQHMELVYEPVPQSQYNPF